MFSRQMLSIEPLKTVGHWLLYDLVSDVAPWELEAFVFVGGSNFVYNAAKESKGIFKMNLHAKLCQANPQERLLCRWIVFSMQVGVFIRFYEFAATAKVALMESLHPGDVHFFPMMFDFPIGSSHQYSEFYGIVCFCPLSQSKFSILIAKWPAVRQTMTNCWRANAVRDNSRASTATDR